DLRLNEADELLHVALKAFVGFVLRSANPEGMSGQARAAVFFKNLENFLPITEGVEERRDGANVESVRAQPEHVAGQPVQFGENDADVICPWRSLNIQQLFDGLTVAQSV